MDHKLVIFLIFLVHMSLESRGYPSHCQFPVMKACNHKFMRVFKMKPYLPSVSNRSLYCSGMQDFMKCLERTKCRGTLIDNYSYVILQHGMMDKKLNICPNHEYTRLKYKVRGIIKKHRFVDDIGVDVPASCSYQVHKRCVTIFTKNMETQSNMCIDVKSFLNCYKREAPRCKALITQHFEHMCNQLGEMMLMLERTHRGVMC